MSALAKRVNRPCPIAEAEKKHYLCTDILTNVNCNQHLCGDQLGTDRRTSFYCFIRFSLAFGARALLTFSVYWLTLAVAVQRISRLEAPILKV